MPRYVRPLDLVAISRGESYIFVVPGRDPAVIEPVDVGLMDSVLAHAAMPVTDAELLEECDATTIEILVGLGVLRVLGDNDTFEPLTRTPSEHKRCKRIVVGISGTISAMASLDRVTAIADLFAEEVDVVVSEGARHMIPPRLFEYSRLRTWLDPFEPAHGAPVPHEHLAMHADVVLIAPASASMLHKLATGACSDLISLVVAATKAPVVIAPSMNPQMWLHPPIRRNVAQLKADGFWIVEPGLCFLIGDRDQGGVGGFGAIDTVGLMRALDVVLARR